MLINLNRARKPIQKKLLLEVFKNINIVKYIKKATTGKSIEPRPETAISGTSDPTTSKRKTKLREKKGDKNEASIKSKTIGTPFPFSSNCL